MPYVILLGAEAITPIAAVWTTIWSLNRLEELAVRRDIELTGIPPATLLFACSLRNSLKSFVMIQGIAILYLIAFCCVEFIRAYQLPANQSSSLQVPPVLEAFALALVEVLTQYDIMIGPAVFWEMQIVNNLFWFVLVALVASRNDFWRLSPWLRFVILAFLILVDWAAAVSFRY